MSKFAVGVTALLLFTTFAAANIQIKHSEPFFFEDTNVITDSDSKLTTNGDLIAEAGMTTRGELKAEEGITASELTTNGDLNARTGITSNGDVNLENGNIDVADGNIIVNGNITTDQIKTPVEQKKEGDYSGCNYGAYIGPQCLVNVIEGFRNNNEHAYFLLHAVNSFRGDVKFTKTPDVSTNVLSGDSILYGDIASADYAARDVLNTFEPVSVHTRLEAKKNVSVQKSLHVNGELINATEVQLQEVDLRDTTFGGSDCNSSTAGAIRYNGTHYGCDGSTWNALY